MNLCSVPSSLLVISIILYLTAAPTSFARALENPVPTQSPLEADTESTPGDLTLTFDTTLAESEETTTSVTSSSSVIVKSGRHFGSRLSPVGSRTTTTPIPSGNLIPPGIKPRPIAYNPTNYNRILKRRQNQTTVITQEISTSFSDGATQPTTSTSQSPTRPHQETDRPTMNPQAPVKNLKVKLGTVRVPTLPPTPAATTVDLEEETLEWRDLLGGPMPPPPTFDPDEDFTLYPDGVYKFKYSSSISSPEGLTSRSSTTEEFTDTFGDHHDDYEGSGGQKLTTEEMLPLEETVPATSKLPTSTLPTVAIHPSEDEARSVSPVYRDYFPDSHGKGQKDLQQLTVTVTVTEKSNVTQPSPLSPPPIRVEKIEKEDLLPTPILPETPLLTTEPKPSINIVPTRATHESSTDVDAEADYRSQVTSPVATFDLDPTQRPVMKSKASTSIYYSTESHPHFISTKFTYASSTEYSFTYPDDQDHHDDDSDHHSDDHGDDHLRRHTVQKNLIQPTSTYRLGENAHEPKTLQHNNTEPDPLLLPVVPFVITTPESTHVEINEVQKGPEPTIASPSIPEKDTKNLTAHDTPAVMLPGNQDTGVATALPEQPEVTEKPADDFSQPFPTHFHLPSVPSYIQILLDLPPAQFCSNVKEFKETIILVYKYNNRQITLDQVVVYQEPACASSSLYKARSAKSSSNSSPTTNSAWNPRSNPKELGNEPEGKDLPDLSGSALYSVYVYILHKNGTYDQLLTEAFIDLWNLTRIDGRLLFNKIKKVEMIISSDIGLGSDDISNENTGVITAITVASIAAFCLLLLGILLLVMRHRQAQNTFAKRCTPVTLDDYSLDNVSVFNSFRRKQRNRTSKRSYTNAGFDDPNAPTRPLDSDGLGTAVKEVGGIFDEFSRIPSVLPTLDDIPAGAETKNRYANVIPMPDTRVLLTFQEESPNSDYINANFVQGFGGNSKTYIVTQGPLEETLIDFWRMIWEQHVRVILMMTDFSEAGIPKCAEYYPRSETIECSQLHGDYQVTLEKREVSENCTTSFLVLKDMARSLRRDVVHLWYHSWPEKGVPLNPQPTVDFLLKTRKYTKEVTPILVHCSPGTGRSGVLVSCDIGLRHLDVSEKVDVPQIVKQLRHDRAGAVQTKEQYRHVYEVLQHYAAKYLSSRSKDVTST